LASASDAQTSETAARPMANLFLMRISFPDAPRPLQLRRRARELRPLPPLL
jgi:hypothetical protein